MINLDSTPHRNRLPVPAKVRRIVFLNPADDVLLTEVCTVREVQRGTWLTPLIRKEAIRLGLRTGSAFTGAKG